MQAYKTILFDWDGCLARSLDVWITTCQEVLAEHGAAPTRAEIVSQLGTLRMPWHFGVQNPDECHQKIGEVARERLKTVTLYDGVREMLDTLYGTKGMAIVSSTRRPILEQGLAHNQLAAYFPVIITGEDVVQPKPHPEGIERAMRRLRATPATTIMIGDSAKDILAAQAAGIDSVLFYTPAHREFHDVQALSKLRPTYQIADFSELLVLLGANSKIALHA